jgi:hypothetical protein
MSPSVKNFLLVLQTKGLPVHSFVSGGTRRSKLLDTFPLPVNAKIFRKGRRRRCHRAGPLQRIFAFISILAVLSFGGFGSSGNRHILNGPSLWERRARNKGLLILKGKQAKSYKTNNDKTRRRRIKIVSIPQAKDAQSRNIWQPNPQFGDL